MIFRMVTKSVTLNDLERRNSPNLCVISPNSVAFGTDYVKDTQLSQRDRAAGVRYSLDQKWKTGNGRQYFTDIIRLSSTTVI